MTSPFAQRMPIMPMRGEWFTKMRLCFLQRLTSALNVVALIVLLFVGLTTLPLFASQALVVQSPAWVGATIPNNEPGWRAISSVRIEGQLDSCTNPVGGDTGIVQFGMSVRIGITGTISLRGFNGESTPGKPRANCSQLRFRARRDVSAAQYTMEVWDEQSGEYILEMTPMTDTATKDLSGGTLFIGKGYEIIYPTMHLGAARVYSTAGSTGAAPPARKITSGYGDLLDYEFEHSLNDSSSHRLNLSFLAGSASYATLTSLPPVVSTSSIPSTIRTGVPTTLDASASFSNDDDPSFTLQWSIAGPYEPTMAQMSNSIIQFVGPISGEYTVTVTIVGAVNTASTTITIGAVATDDNGVVIIPDANINRIVGPILRLGVNPWSWFDDRALAVANNQIRLQTTGGPRGVVGPWRNVWNVANPHGVISVTNGVNTITGTETQFQDDFCGGSGNTTPASTSNTIAVWYEDSDYPGSITRAFYGITACVSQTQLTISRKWGHATGVQSGLNYTVIDPNQIAWWGYSSTPANYYDNVLAFYIMYYRTGLTKYRDAARTLAQNFWEGPSYSRGRNYDTSSLEGNFIAAGPARGQAPTGLVLWALESGENIWPGLHHLWEWQKYVAHDYPQAKNWNIQIDDVRETGYATSALALCAQYDTDSTWRATCRTALKETIMKVWVPLQVPGNGHGNWRQAQAANGVYGPVTVTKGSSAVTLNSGTWTSNLFSGYLLWFTKNPVIGFNNGNVGDMEYYTGTFVDETHITLDRNYSGPSGNKSMWVSTLVGFGSQPFMQGIWGGQAGSIVYDSLIASGDTTEANIVKQFSIDSANWLVSKATNSSDHTIYYGAEYLNCEPLGSDPAHCGNGPVLNGEVIKNFSAAYRLSGDPALKAAGDSYYTRMWCKPTGGWTCGTPGYGVYMNDIDDSPGAGGYMLAPDDPLSNKWFGFFFGYGAGASWPAARLGEPQAPEGLTVNIPILLDAHPRSTKVRITIVTPTGVTTSSICTSSPCRVVIDSRLGKHLMKLDYLSADDQVVAPGRFRPLAAK